MIDGATGRAPGITASIRMTGRFHDVDKIAEGEMIEWLLSCCLSPYSRAWAEE
jgi:hypothetical protein